MKKIWSIMCQVLFWILSLSLLVFSILFFSMDALVSCFILLITAIIINPIFCKLVKKNTHCRNWMKLLIAVVGFLSSVFFYPSTVDKDNDGTNSVGTESDDVVVSESINYAGELIDINNLDMYPFGDALKNALEEIGVDDGIEAVCETDNISGLTIKLTTETKRLWLGFDDLFDDIREVEWIKDYDDHSIYYYLSDELDYYNEPIYSYKTKEIIKDKIDGESEKYPLVITVEQLVDEINADISSAREKYNGKWVQVTGTIGYISDGGGMYGYYLYGKQGEDGLKITCWIEGDIKHATVGATKTFLGIMREITLVNNTEIAKCKIVE